MYVRSVLIISFGILISDKYLLDMIKAKGDSKSATEGVGFENMSEYHPSRTGISGMFDEIAKKYDFLNHFLSMSVDKRWRKRLVGLSGISQRDLILDVCAGTCDISIEFARMGQSGRIVGVDFSTEMLKIGRQKIENRGYRRKIGLFCGDAQRLPFKDETFDVATMGFGLRNLTDYRRGIKEMARVVKRGGRILILEFAPPRATSLNILYRFYLTKIIPIIGTILTGKRGAYRYLSTSVSGFLEPSEVLEIMRSEDLKNLESSPLTGGIAYIYCGKR